MNAGAFGGFAGIPMRDESEDVNEAEAEVEVEFLGFSPCEERAIREALGIEEMGNLEMVNTEVLSYDGGEYPPPASVQEAEIRREVESVPQPPARSNAQRDVRRAINTIEGFLPIMRQHHLIEDGLDRSPERTLREDVISQVQAALEHLKDADDTLNRVYARMEF